jgi:hypothetical protein
MLTACTHTVLPPAVEKMPLDSEEAADKSKLALENRRLREENRLLKYKLEVLIDMVRSPVRLAAMYVHGRDVRLNPSLVFPHNSNSLLPQLTVAKVDANTRAR